MVDVKDLKLVAPVLGLWSGCAMALWAESQLWILLGVVLAVVTLALLKFPRSTFVVFALLGVVVTSIRIFPLKVDLPSAPMEMDFVVTTDPVAKSSSGKPTFGNSYSLHADAHVPFVLTFPETWTELVHAVPTSRWRCLLTLTSTHVLHRFSAFGRCHSPPERIAGPSRYQGFATSLRESLADVTYRSHDEDSYALLPALVEGDTRGQSNQLTRTMQNAGLGHLTAVSGANVAILFAALNFVLLRWRMSARLRLVILVLSLIAFVAIARPTPSVVRAAVMAALALSYWWFGYRRHVETVLLVAVLVLLAIDPWLAVSWGFALSVAATAGLIVLPRLWGVSSHGRVSQVVFTATAATLATVPLLVAMGSNPTFASIPANVLAEIFVAPATVTGFIALVCAPLMSLPLLGYVFTAVVTVAVWIGALSTRVILLIAENLNHTWIATSVISWSGFFGVVTALTLLWWLGRKYLSLVAVCFLAVLFASSRVESWIVNWPPDDWEIVACDVGQGDSSVIRTGSHSALVIDVGGDAMLMDECLQRLDVNRIDLFVASHFHADHIGGISGLIHNREVVSALLPPQQSPARHLVDSLIPSSRNAQVGDNGHFGDVSWNVVFVGGAVTNIDDGSQVNNSSVVVVVTVHGHAVLFTGDIEETAQEELMHSIQNPHISAVKIPHHGSRYQSPQFASWLHPALAWASVGANNDYGHPAIETLNAYRAIGAVVLTTMDCGSISLRFVHGIEWRGMRSCHA